MTPSASALPPTFAALTAVFALAYGLIDGCALGAGILFPLLARRADTQPLFDSITLLWGANVLILVSGGILFLTGFPLAYSTLLPMVYVPLLIMLVSLVLRGVGYECQGRNSALQPVWQWSFSLGSIAATLCQGWMLGTIVEGIGAQPDSGELERIVRLLLPLTCSVGLLGGYTLLGSAWLIWKTRGALQVLGREVGFSSLILTAAAVATLCVCAPIVSDYLAHRWLTRGHLAVLWIPPAIAIVIGWRVKQSLWGAHDGAPLLWVALLFVTGFTSIAVSLYPFVVPYRHTLWDAANDGTSLQFAGLGILIVMPLIVLYLSLAFRGWRDKVPLDTKSDPACPPHIGARRTAGHQVNLHLS